MALRIETLADRSFSAFNYVAYENDDVLISALKMPARHCAQMAWAVNPAVGRKTHLSNLQAFLRTLRRSGLQPYEALSSLTVATDPQFAAPLSLLDSDDGAPDPRDRIDLELVASMPLPTGYLYVNFGTPWGDAVFRRERDGSQTYLIHSHLPIAPLLCDFVARTHRRTLARADVVPLCNDVFSFGLPYRGPSLSVRN